IVGVFQFGAEEVDFVAAGDHLFNEVQSFGGAAAAGRVERFVGEKGDALHGSDIRKRSSIAVARSRDFMEIHSSTVCAWAISPGPKTMQGMPPAARTAASQ